MDIVTNNSNFFLCVCKCLTKVGAIQIVTLLIRLGIIAQIGTGREIVSLNNYHQVSKDLTEDIKTVSKSVVVI